MIAGGLATAACLARSALRQSRWFLYRGKNVIVAGGSRGLGLVIARYLVDAGAKVAICARTKEDLETAERELRQRARGRGGRVVAITCDIRDPKDARRMVDEVAATFGSIDVLMNVAGIIQVGPLGAMTLDDFHDAMATNCWGPLHTILAAVPHMRQRGWGRIVNVGSIGGKQAVPHLLPYVASKFALVGLSNGLRTELAKDGILVTTASPTLMRTGSPRNALFKGQHRKEYAWFSLGGAMPIASMSAEQAARQILRACQNGDGDVMIMNHANIGVWIRHLMPRATTEVFSLVNALLPGMGGIGRRAARGYQSESAVSPSILTVLADRAAERNNEMRPHPVG